MLLCTEEIMTGLIHTIGNSIRASEWHVYWKDSEKVLLCLLKRHLEIYTLGEDPSVCALSTQKSEPKASRFSFCNYIPITARTTTWSAKHTRLNSQYSQFSLPVWLLCTFSKLIRWWCSSLEFYFVLTVKNRWIFIANMLILSNTVF